MGLFDFFKGKENFVVHPGSLKPMVILVLDGWGRAPSSDGNAITQAALPNISTYERLYPHGELIASGESVGLPANEDGNSEVGHLTIGAGRVVLQSLKRINKAIEDSSFYGNAAFLQALSHVKQSGGRIHLLGLVGTGGVHSSIEHFYALLEFLRRNEVNNALFHLITDGRDTPPQEAKNIIAEVEQRVSELKVGEIASIGGRYYAMDRDRRWERTQKMYEAMTIAKGQIADSAVNAVAASYAKGLTDEFIEPTVIVRNGQPVGVVNDNDAVIFFNFRVDRPRQLSMTFTISDFENLKAYQLGFDPDQGTSKEKKHTGPTFKREKVIKNLFFVTMTEYQKGMPVSAIAFPPENVDKPIPEVLSLHGLKQLHLTESEKERMVTFYFDGLREEKFPGEDVLIIPSPKVATYDKAPEMSVFKVVSEFKKAIQKSQYHFYVLNFANPDMVAHSGNLKATIRACEFVDRAVGELVNAVLAYDGTVVISADHGNAEELLTYDQSSFFFTTNEGSTNTDHSNNPVPVYIIANSLRGNNKVLPQGALSDIAPTVLNLMGLPVPDGMTGKNLLG